MEYGYEGEEVIDDEWNMRYEGEEVNSDGELDYLISLKDEDEDEIDWGDENEEWVNYGTMKRSQFLGTLEPAISLSLLDTIDNDQYPPQKRRKINHLVDYLFLGDEFYFLNDEDEEVIYSDDKEIEYLCSLNEDYDNDKVAIKTVLNHNGYLLFTAESLLTPTQCDTIYQNIMEMVPFEIMSVKYPSEKRNNERAIVRDEITCQYLWDQLQPSLLKTFLNLQPTPPPPNSSSSNDGSSISPPPSNSCSSHDGSSISPPPPNGSPSYDGSSISNSSTNSYLNSTSPLTPLGFSVGGKWSLSGMNPVFRINKYKEGDHFSPHKDAQYSPNPDERSLLSMVLYLTDEFASGSTVFYIPKQQQPVTSNIDQTIVEEIESRGGLTTYDTITFFPKKGTVLLFSHNILHESISPVLTSSTYRMVLRSDILVRRTENSFGFSISPAEREDYIRCLNIFREAQQMELNNKNSIANDLYERALSIRYAYPARLSHKQSPEESRFSRNIFNNIPVEIWFLVLQYLDPASVENLTIAYPDFIGLRMMWENDRKEQVERDPLRPFYIPRVKFHQGVVTGFYFDGVEFFKKNRDSCLRVAAVYAFVLMGHHEKTQTYIVKFNANTQEICEVDIRVLLADVFYNRRCSGAFYKVRQMEPSKKDIQRDFQNSVDRTYMMLRHNTEFIGNDILPQLNIRLERFRRVLYSGFSTSAESRTTSRSYSDEEFFLPTPQKFITETLQFSENKYGVGSSELIDVNHTFSPYEWCYCYCGFHDDRFDFTSLLPCIKPYNHLIFDFEKYNLTVQEILKDEAVIQEFLKFSDLYRANPTEFCHFKVDISPLVSQSEGFNHASCQCWGPEFTVVGRDLINYTHLTDVDMLIKEEKSTILVIAVYQGVVSL